MLPLLEELGYTLTFQRAATIVGGNSYTISHRARRRSREPTGPHRLQPSRNSTGGATTRAARMHWCRTISIAPTRSGASSPTESALRLLRNSVRFSKPSLLEFDLEAIFAGNLYSEFVLFYRLVHATRLPRGGATRMNAGWNDTTSRESSRAAACASACAMASRRRCETSGQVFSLTATAKDCGRKIAGKP